MKGRNTFNGTYCVPCFRVSKVLPGVSKGHFSLFRCLPTFSPVAKESQCFLGERLGSNWRLVAICQNTSGKIKGETTTVGKNTGKVVHAWRHFPLFRGIKIKPRWAVMQCMTKYHWKNLLLKFYYHPSLFLFSCHYSSSLNPADGLKLLNNKNFYTQERKMPPQR